MRWLAVGWITKNWTHSLIATFILSDSGTVNVWRVHSGHASFLLSKYLIIVYAVGPSLACRLVLLEHYRWYRTLIKRNDVLCTQIAAVFRTANGIIDRSRDRWRQWRCGCFEERWRMLLGNEEQCNRWMFTISQLYVDVAFDEQWVDLFADLSGHSNVVIVVRRGHGGNLYYLYIWRVQNVVCIWHSGLYIHWHLNFAFCWILHSSTWIM